MHIIGVDGHKRVHAAVAIDEQGQEISHWRGANTPAGWAEVQTWGAVQATGACWGLAGAGQYERGLAQTLVQQGIVVVEVNLRPTAGKSTMSRERKIARRDEIARCVDMKLAAKCNESPLRSYGRKGLSLHFAGFCCHTLLTMR